MRGSSSVAVAAVDGVDVATDHDEEGVDVEGDVVDGHGVVGVGVEGDDHGVVGVVVGVGVEGDDGDVDVA